MQRVVLFMLSILLLASCQQNPIDFNAQVKPIINKRCISCHGGVKRNNGFSLLFRQDALDTTDSGKPAIIPGDIANSEFIKRINHHDPEERMPYKKDPLPQEEIEILTQWIKEGANWGDHWAYVTPQPVEIPSVSLMAGLISSENFVQNNIDRFVLKKLDERSLAHNPKATSEVLLRRLYLDIIGIPPTMEEVNSFLADPSETAYEDIVNKLLGSPKYGEKWASWWLDMARYADTKGYEKDQSRQIWRYRDWVIKALNQDMPFDEFTIEQLAGDLLPNPTDDQLIATGFHRNTMNNDEGGTDDEEFRIATVIDRVNTTYQVWQSTTFSCVQCHSHPYDPFRHEEYYKSLAFFNNTRDEDTQGDYPKLRFYKGKDSVEVNTVLSWFNQFDEQQTKSLASFIKTLEPKFHAHVCDSYANGALVDTKWMGIRHGGFARVPKMNLDNKQSLLIRYSTGSMGGRYELRIDNARGEIISQGVLTKTADWEIKSFPIKSISGTHDLFWRFYNNSIHPNVAVCLVEWFTFMNELPGKGEVGYDSAKARFLKSINRQVEATPIMVESPEFLKRKTNVFERGNWMVRGAEVTPQTPQSLGRIDASNPNRLSLANWLVNPNNPLTSRTITNRIWEQIFGQGLVSTIEDFGTQGELPSHPELLDYLSLKLMQEYQWSLKSLIKEIVMSGTYQQSSEVKDWEVDPTNKWLSRGPRFRLTSEQVHDQALHVAGLLSHKMYGPGVMPYQPSRVWQSVYSGERWNLSDGEDRFRRAVYTFVKRTSVYPSFMIFDGSSREVCQVQRMRTNTPLQALVTLNDPVYTEAARIFAASVNPNLKAIDKIKQVYKRALLKDIDDESLIALLELYTNAYREYQNNKEALQQIVGCLTEDVGLGALTVTCLAVYNLDEFLTKG